MGDWFIESGRLVGLCIHWLRESVSGGMEVPHRRKRRHRKHVHATGNKYCRASHVLLSTVRSWTLLLPHGRMVPGSAVPLTERLGQLKARPGTARFEQRRRTGQRVDQDADHGIFDLPNGQPPALRAIGSGLGDQRSGDVGSATSGRLGRVTVLPQLKVDRLCSVVDGTADFDPFRTKRGTRAA